MTRRVTPVDLPGEPLIVEGVKYRIREVLASSTPTSCAVVTAKARYGGEEVTAEVTEYDPTPGIFRGRALAPGEVLELFGS